MLELLVLGAFLGFVFLCAACSFGRAPQSGRVKVTRPRPDSVDGFGGTRAHDYSYTSAYGAPKPPLPVGLRVEREKTQTHKAFSEKEDQERLD